MSLFDQLVRDYYGPALYAEPAFAYLNRSARPSVQKIRDALEDWFSRYSDQYRRDIEGRFRSTDDWQHRAAFFELFLHELLLRLGCRVEIHPTVEGVSTRPDFLAECLDGNRFFLEAVLATDESRDETAARARMNAVYDALNRMESPNFFLGIQVRGAPETPPSARRMRDFLEAQLATLDVEEIARRFEEGGFRALPRWQFQHEGWQIEFFPIPKSPQTRGQTGIRPLGLQFDEVRWVDARTPIRDCLIEKAGRYGALRFPYVIAVNGLADFVDRIAIMEALFGKETFVFLGSLATPRGPEFRRVPDGLWTSPTGPRHTSVSAVLVAVQLYPWKVASAPLCLYHNPWAARPYDSQFNRLARACPQLEDRMEWFDGESLAAIFGLPADWPGE